MKNTYILYEFVLAASWGYFKKLKYLPFIIVFIQNVAYTHISQPDSLLILLQKKTQPHNNGRFVSDYNLLSDTAKYKYPKSYHQKRIWSADFDPAEIYFQFFKKGYTSKSFFDSLSIVHILDTLLLNKNKNAQTFSVFVGIKGDFKHVILDLNRNFDFTDDSLRIFPINNKDNRVYNYEADEKIAFNYKSLIGGKYSDRNVNFKIIPFENASSYLDSTETIYKIYLALHEYMAGEFIVNGKQYQIVLGRSEGINYGFDKGYVAFREPSRPYLRYDPPLKLGHFFDLENEKYRISHISFWGDTVLLTKVIHKPTKVIGFREGEYVESKRLKSLKDGSITNLLNPNDKTDLSIYFIDFWGSWCKPCIEKMDSIKILYKNFKNKIQFVGIAFDKTIASAQSVLKTKNINWLQFYVERPGTATDFISQMNVSCFPTYLILLSNGKILFRGCGVPISTIQNKLNEALNTNINGN